MTPILAVDIDGVLNALGGGAPAPGWTDMLVCRSEGSEMPRLFRLRFSQGHGAKMLALAAETGAELTWCTRWERMANDLMRHLAGLPELPWVPMQASKLAALHAYAAGRPFVWIDDEEPPLAEFLAHEGPYRVICPDPSLGLRDEHLDRARDHLRELAA